MSSSENALRKEMVFIGKQMHDKGFVSASDGNIACRVSNNRVISTPSGKSKGFLSPGDLVVTDLNGKKISGKGKPTSELELHLAAFKERPDIRASIHSHAPFAVACSVAGIDLGKIVLPEAYMIFGRVPVTPYATPSSGESPKVTAEFIKKCDAMVIDRHGTFTVGKTLMEAYMKLEKLEHFAFIMFICSLKGRIKTLNRQQLRKIDEIRRKYGLSTMRYI
ncbi:MAG: class II aldolase/adducin family protein [Candidatus Aureabacteria bacterium]|nr:class II aldolase/adducin family protein [Candidatus Auribacterota bacterium]